MLINSNNKSDELPDFVVKADLPAPTEAYRMHIKAEALRLANLYQEAISKYLNSILLDRNNPDSFYGLGICYKKVDKIKKAIGAFEKAKVLRKDDANIYYELGVCYLIEGEVCLAMQHFVKSLKINPKNLNAQIQLAIAHEIVEEPEMALMIYQKIIETSPGYIKAYDHKSSLLMTLERYYDASLVLNEIIKINPSFYRAYLGIGICFDKMGRMSDAKRYYRKFLEQKPFSQHAEFVKTRLGEIKATQIKPKSACVMKLVK